MLEKITKSSKICALLGDFNVDLIKYGDNQLIDSFYDQISSHGFRPLILQPTHVSSNSATLIDNIFINDIACFAKSFHLAYKTHRNRVVSLIRISKKQYYAKFFEEHHSNVKKTWDGIRDLINVSKKSSTNLSKLVSDKKMITNNRDIADTMNDFFVNDMLLMDLDFI